MKLSFGKYKKILITLVFALILWLGILIFGVLETSKEAYFNYIPENVLIYLNLETEQAKNLFHYKNEINNYSENIYFEDFKNIISVLKDNFVFTLYKDHLNNDQVLIIGKSNTVEEEELQKINFNLKNKNAKVVQVKNNILIYKTDRSFNIESNFIGEYAWQKNIKKYLTSGVFFYMSEKIHQNQDLDDIIGRIKFVEDKVIKFDIEKASDDKFTNSKSIDNILIPKNYIYSIYFDNNYDFKRLFSSLDENLFPVFGKYLDNPSFDFLVSFNELKKEGDYQITMVNKGHKNLYDNFIQYIKENLSYMYPIKEELTLGDGTVVEEVFADQNVYVKSFDSNSIKIGVEDQKLDFTIKRDGNNILISKSNFSEEVILLSTLHEKCKIESKNYPFLYKGNDLQIFLQNNGKLIEGCLSF